MLETTANGLLPAEIRGLIDRTLLFKVATKSNLSQRFEQTFKVRKICSDIDIIKQFKDKWEKEEAIFVKNTNVI